MQKVECVLICSISLAVKRDLAKVESRVRFPYIAPETFEVGRNRRRSIGERAQSSLKEKILVVQVSESLKE